MIIDEYIKVDSQFFNDNENLIVKYKKLIINVPNIFRNQGFYNLEETIKKVHIKEALSNINYNLNQLQHYCENKNHNMMSR